MAKAGRPTKAQTLARALELRETLQTQIVARLTSSMPIRKVLVDMGKKVTLPDLKHMAYAHILDVMNDDKVNARDRFPYIKLVFELNGDIGKNTAEVQHKHTVEFSEGTRELLAQRVKQLIEQDRKAGDVIDVIPEGEHYHALPPKGKDGSDGELDKDSNQATGTIASGIGSSDGTEDTQTENSESGE